MAGLENLSPIDFEDLCRDLASADTGKRFSAFGPGPDGGVDGRHAKGHNNVILQCKHYLTSSFSDLKTALRKEVDKLKKLTPAPTRYLFFTSQSLTPSKSGELAEIASAFLKEAGDIWGKDDIEDAIRRNPDIEKSHFKLWLSSTAVLEHILERTLRSGQEAYTQMTKEEIDSDLRVYVHNESFHDAAKLLKREKILIISGPPGVGKTILGRMITYHFLIKKWHFIAINSIEEAFSRIDIDDRKRTVFFFDDFLGKVELNRQTLQQNDTRFGVFLKRVRESNNTRFILTTRAHIFQQARLLADSVDDGRLQLSKYILDVGRYTRRVKSLILYNHLYSSALTPEYVTALLNNNWLKKIVDHDNYNPRIIASISSGCLDNVIPKKYPSYVFNALQRPDRIWKNPFERLDMKCQNLLVCLFFSNERGEKIDVLRVNFSDVNRLLCQHYSHHSKPDDFETALHSLESGFITISEKTVTFVNPSLRDFLKAYLMKDIEFLHLLPKGVKRADWAKRLWDYVRFNFMGPNISKKFALEFVGLTSVVNEASPDDLRLPGRIELLLSWGEYSGEAIFFQCASKLSQSTTLKPGPWKDGEKIIELYSTIDDEDYYSIIDDVSKQKIKDGCMQNLIELLRKHTDIEIHELIGIIKSVDKNIGDYSILGDVGQLEDHLYWASDYHFKQTEDAITDFCYEEEFSEYSEYLNELAKLTNKDETSIEMAQEIIAERLSEFESIHEDESDPDFSTNNRSLENDKFDDDDLRSLFSTLT